MKIKNMLPLNLQMFAKEEDDDKDENLVDNEDNNGENDDSRKDSKEKTFSQKDVNAMMAKEKNEGRKATLNALGVENVEDAKKAIEFFKKFNETFNGEKNPEEIQKALEGEKTKAEERAMEAENKLACIMAGVNKDSIDDVLAIASAKVTEDKDLSKVLEEMKTQAKYSGFYNEVKESTGTGSDMGHGKSNDVKQSLAQRLAEQNKSSKTNKKSYFS